MSHTSHLLIVELSNYLEIAHTGGFTGLCLIQLIQRNDGGVFTAALQDVCLKDWIIQTPFDLTRTFDAEYSAHDKTFTYQHIRREREASTR